LLEELKVRKDIIGDSYVQPLGSGASYSGIVISDGLLPLRSIAAGAGADRETPTDKAKTEKAERVTE